MESYKCARLNIQWSSSLQTTCQIFLPLIPATIPPNAITLTAIALNIVLWLSASFLHAYILVLILCMIQVLNALDGMQARRTNNATALGELLNHLCRILTLFVFISILNISSSIPYTIASYTICYKHYRAKLDGYTTNNAGIGNTDIIFVIYFMYLTGWYDAICLVMIMFDQWSFGSHPQYMWWIILIHSTALYMHVNAVQNICICVLLSQELIINRIKDSPLQNTDLIQAALALAHPIVAVIITIGILIDKIKSIDWSEIFLSKPVVQDPRHLAEPADLLSQDPSHLAEPADLLSQDPRHLAEPADLLSQDPRHLAEPAEPAEPKLVLHFTLEDTVMFPPAYTDMKAKVLLAKNIFGRVKDGRWRLNPFYTQATNSVSYYDYLKDASYTDRTAGIQALPCKHTESAYDAVLEAMKQSSFFDSLQAVVTAYPNALIVCRSFHTESIDAIVALKQHAKLGVIRRTSNAIALVFDDGTVCRNLAEINDLYRKSTGILLIHEDYPEADFGNTVVLSDPDLIHIIFSTDTSRVEYRGHDNIDSHTVNTIDAVSRPKYYTDRIYMSMLKIKLTTK